ncbi:MAG TPA: chemotaxis protein CheB [Bacteroidales bacterium]|nr:chemotaxis protein CheB [Bacteroidales bacterium]
MRTKAKKPDPKVLSKKINPVKETTMFPIVGIGASAGGLEALEQFLGNVSENSGMAFVVIQHLDPTQKGMLPELLQRSSKIKVKQAKDLMRIEKNTIYVIPPNKSMSVLHRVLHLFEPAESRGMRLPIDFFLRSLADDCKEFGIGIILSGMGSDGSIGLRAIKEKNGIVMVQDPRDARFDSMPRNAIDSVIVDIIAPAYELPIKLEAFIKNQTGIIITPDIEVKDKSSLDKIIILLRTHTGNDFSMYKKNTLYRRIDRRMGIHKIDKIISYVHFLQGNPKEIEILFKELLIGVTNFFRDPEVWDNLRDKVFPDMFSKLPPGTVLRAWVPGCSTGEEAYSLAIIFKEALERNNHRPDFSLQIFASDIDSDAIMTARKGIFTGNIVADVSAERLNRFFSISDEGYRVNTEIREMLVFAQHNVILHPPFTKLDFISCRNLLIYMDNELQKKLLGLFYYSINDDGILLLGSSETLGAQSDLFTAVDGKQKIFSRNASARSTELLNFPSSFTRLKSFVSDKRLPDRSGLNIQMIAEQQLLHYYSPSAVFVNEAGDIVYIHGHTGKYLEPPVGKANLNIFAMLRENLRNEFFHAFHQVIAKKEPVGLRNIRFKTNGDTQLVNIDIQLIDKPEILYGYLMILFTDVKMIPETHKPLKTRKGLAGIKQMELEDEIKRMREEMQNTLEELQTGQEELRSTNEELQSTNEELQSTNEELTTSKEEMQSLNEELQTVNAELQAKVDDFSRVNNDMKNLLNSTEIATLFLDKELNIMRFTLQTTKLIKLIKSDIGRPFTDQASDLNYSGLEGDANEVLRTLVFMQKEIPTKDGRWFLVRIMPYRTFDDRIDGLVITFINISEQKKIEAKLLNTEKINQFVLSASTDIMLILSTGFNIKEFNPEAEKFFGKSRETCMEKDFIKLFIPEKEQQNTEKKLKMLFGSREKAKLKMKLITATNIISMADCSVNLSINNQSIAESMILSIKTQQNHE